MNTKKQTQSKDCLTRVWQPLFPFLWQKRSSLPSKLGEHLRSTTMCMYKQTFWLNSAKCWFCSLGPIVKFSHCQQYKSRVCVLLAIVGTGQNFQWNPISKINILRSSDKNVFIHTCKVVLLRCLPSLYGKLERFVTKKKWKKRLPKSSQRDYSRKTMLDFKKILHDIRVHFNNSASSIKKNIGLMKWNNMVWLICVSLQLYQLLSIKGIDLYNYAMNLDGYHCAISTF